MNAKTYTQFGKTSLIILLPLVLFFTYILGKTGVLTDPDAVFIFPVFLALLFAFLLMYKLSITVDDQSVSFKMGIGFVSKSYKIEKIKACYPVTNKWILGFGIRMLKNGTLYNVSGNKAIELHFYDRDSVVRIGTDRPEEISELIQEKIGRNVVDEMIVPEKKRRINWNLIIVPLVLLFALTITLLGQREQKVTIENRELKIRALYSLTIPLDEIAQIDTVSHLPAISARTNGYALGKTLKGNFRLKDKSNVKLFVHVGNPPYIFIKSSHEKPVYLNFKDKNRTLKLYEELKAR